MQTYVCDTGTYYLKLGNCDYNFPEFVIPCLIGKPNGYYMEFNENHASE